MSRRRVAAVTAGLGGPEPRFLPWVARRSSSALVLLGHSRVTATDEAGPRYVDDGDREFLFSEGFRARVGVRGRRDLWPA